MSQAGDDNGTTVHHVALRVAHLDRATAWYGAALGFGVEHRGQVPEGVAIAMLRTPGGAGVELFELGAGTTEAWDGPIPALSGGVTHFGLHVADVQGSFDRAVAAGGRPIWPPRDAPVSGMRIAFLADPDGNIVELVGPAPR
jgi:catechol 2,3-dioxygenase-like lactoylglutathione lyase family enzyme